MKIAIVRTCLATLFSFLAVSAWAGGSWEAVEVRSLRWINATDYELVVAPEPNDDGYLGKCELFTVIGIYAERPPESHWWDIRDRFGPSVTRDGHIAALALMERGRSSGQHVNFGWMGSGFEAIDKEHPCIVRSRALQIMRADGVVAIVSYFHRV